MLPPRPRCGRNQGALDGTVAAALRWSVFVVLLQLLVPQLALAKPLTRVFLNGVPAAVHFNDGDSFAVQSGEFAGTKARLAGYNTLESFGPCHKWGNWDAHELYVLAKKATLNARRGVWHCFSDGKRDGYGRILWNCPDLIEDQVRKGLAHAMTVTDQPAEERYLKAQRLAQAERRGIWAHGIPKYVLTSLHSNDEGYEGATYNRLVSSETGASTKWLHKDNYKECEWVCHETGACMLYIGFTRRYGATRAACLRH